MIIVPDYTLEEEEEIRPQPKTNVSMNEIIIKELKELTISIIKQHPYYAAFIIISCLLLTIIGFILLYSLNKGFKRVLHKALNKMRIRINCSHRYCFRLQIDNGSKFDNKSSDESTISIVDETKTFTTLNKPMKNKSVSAGLIIASISNDKIISSKSYANHSPQTPNGNNRYIFCTELYCDFMAISYQSASDHFKNHLKYEKYQYKCQVCKYGTDTDDDLKMHYNDSHLRF